MTANHAERPPPASGRTVDAVVETLYAGSVPLEIMSSRQAARAGHEVSLVPLKPWSSPHGTAEASVVRMLPVKGKGTIRRNIAMTPSGKAPTTHGFRRPHFVDVLSEVVPTTKPRRKSTDLQRATVIACERIEWLRPSMYTDVRAGRTARSKPEIGSRKQP